MRTRRAIVAATVLAAATAGCSHGGVKRLRFDQPLPSCDAIATAVAGQGMSSPSPGLTQRGSTGPTVDCSFVPPVGAKPPGVAYTYVVLNRPTYDGFAGNTVPSWGKDFSADAQCGGTVADDATLPGGRSCYAESADHEGTAKVTGYTKMTGISVLLRWDDPAATGEKLRTDTLAKADAVAAAIAGML